MNDRGEELDCVRRKAAKNSLRGPDDVLVVADGELHRFCGNIDQERFKNFFGIDHAVLVDGGKKIAAGGGSIADILFAGGGVNDLKTVLAGLEQESGEIYVPNGKKPRLNHSLSQLAQAKKLLRDSALPVAQWTEHRQLLDSATERKHAAETELQAQTREQSRLKRFEKALPLIVERSDLQAKLAEVTDAPVLSPKFGERRIEAQERLRAAQRAQGTAAAAIADCREQLEKLDVPKAVLAQRPRVEQLVRRSSVYEAARDDRPGLVARASRLDQDVIGTLRKLGNDLDPAAAEALHVPETKRLRIRKLGEQYGGISHDVEHWTSQVADLDRERSEKRSEIAALPPPHETAHLAAALQQAQHLGDVDEQRTQAVLDGQTLVQQTTIELKRLPLWSRSLEELEAAPLPLAESIDRFEADFAAIERELATLARQSQDCSNEKNELSQKLDALRLEFDLPTEVELAKARQARDECWRAIREHWLARSPGQHASPQPARSDRADAFERNSEAADKIADRLRHEAERVAEHAQFLTRQIACTDRLESLEQQRQAIQTR